MTPRTRLAAIIVLLSIALAVTAGCTDAPRRSSGTGEPAATKLTGEQILKTKCVYCHNDDRIDTATYDLAGWEAAIDRMNGRGATVDSSQKAVLAEYLANR